MLRALALALFAVCAPIFADTIAPVPVPWLPMEVHRWTMAELEDTSIAAPVQGSTPAAAKDTSKLRIEGSKTIRVGVGGTGGMALDQSLQLSADGDLAPGIHMKARVSDGNLPLSSQGSSTTLRDVDELWLEVWSDHWGTRLGDQDWVLGPGLGSGFQRRIRGWSGTWKPDGAQATVVIGGPQARWTRMSFEGVEGQQEGYVLVKSATSLLGAIVPGSERVRVNGELMTRGGDADYSVRYLQGLLDFTTHRRIHAADLIEVEFQAADLDYQRTFAGVSVNGKAGAWSYEAWGVREADEADHPLSYAPDSLTRQVLSGAGADSSKALDSSGNRIPLPQQTGEAGVRLNWGDSSTWVRSDLRGATLDRNVMSAQDGQISGTFGAAEAGMRWGSFAPFDGGRWTLKLRGEVLESSFHGLSSADTLGSNSSDWAGDPVAAATGRTDGSGDLSWELAPGLGVWTRSEAREAGPAFLSLTSATAGLDRGPDRQVLTKASWSRRDDGIVPLELDRTMARAAMPFGSLVPRIEGDFETRDARDGNDANRRYSRWGLVGGKWTDPLGWSLDLEGNARADASDFSRTVPGGVDTAQSVGAKGAAKWSARWGTVDVDADWTRTEKRVSPQFPWTESGSWIGEATTSAAPLEGLRTTGHWRLSTSAYQPEIPAYDTVPVGTGSFRYDTTLREVVPSDEGNLRWMGTKLDTTRPAVRASSRVVGAEIEAVPGKLVRGLRGVLADLGGRLRGDVQQTDSSASLQLLPDFSDADLSRSAQAQSELEATLWWTREGKRLEGTWTRRLSMGMTSIGVREREMDERLDWTSTIGKGHRLELRGEHGDLDQSEPGYVRSELRWRGEPSLGIRVIQPVEIKPGYVVQTGSGLDNGTAFSSLEQAPYVDLSVELPHGLHFRSEVRRAAVDVAGPVGSRLTDDYPAGTTWRGSAGLDWTWRDHVQAHADWTLRLEPDKPLFQKLSIEARAVF